MSHDTQIVVGDSIKAIPTTDGKTIKLELRWMTVDEEHPERFPTSWGIVLEFPFDLGGVATATERFLDVVKLCAAESKECGDGH